MHAILAVLVFIGALLTMAAPAEADCFDGEQNIYVGNYQVDTAYGTTNTFDIRDRNLATQCTGPAAFSTAQLGSSTARKQVEVGWHEYENVVGQHDWCIFWEAQNGNAIWGGACSGQYYTSPAPDVRFRVAYNSTYDTFRYYVDAGSGFVELTDPGPHGFNQDLVAFTYGWPKGEVGRRGGTGTGAHDEQSHLHYREGSTGSNWVSWTNNGTQGGAQDSMPGWKWCKISATHYVIIKDADTC